MREQESSRGSRTGWPRARRVLLFSVVCAAAATFASATGAVLVTDSITTIAGGGTSEQDSSVRADVRRLMHSNTVAVTSGGETLYVGTYFPTSTERENRLYKVTRGSLGFSSELHAWFARAIGGLALASDGRLTVAHGCAVELRGGSIERVAGGNSCSYSGDGGPAANARLRDPRGIAWGRDGTLYIADAGNHRVRFVKDGTIETLAGTGVAGQTGDGGSATAARVSSPRDVTVDSLHNVFVATDTRVRMITPTGRISTVVDLAGKEKPCASSAEPVITGLAVDGARNLYAAVAPWSHVYKIALSGTIERIVGTADCDAQALGDGGEAGSAVLERPHGLALDRNGSLYVAENAGRIRYVRNFPPRATLSARPTSGTAPLTVTFDPAGSFDPNGVIGSYAYSFKYPNPFAKREVSKHLPQTYTYNARGTYTARLTVTDDSGATAVASVTITVR